jgi:PIN domain nuclease of toxin-antitoxin system
MADRLLLDTCACLWLMQGDRMSASSLQAIGAAQASRSGIYVSAITGWEVATLVRRGRYRLQVSAQTWFDRVVNLLGMRLAEITPEILIDATDLPGTPPPDPADRIIAATARHHGLVLVSRDRQLIDYGEQGHLRTLTC